MTLLQLMKPHVQALLHLRLKRIVVLRLTLPKPGHYRQPYQKPELLLIC
jgi:hypothetical protein